MDATKFVVVVACKVPLSEADMRFLQLDMAARLQATLVQKIASVTFTKESNGSN